MRRIFLLLVLVLMGCSLFEQQVPEKEAAEKAVVEKQIEKIPEPQPEATKTEIDEIKNITIIVSPDKENYVVGDKPNLV